LGVHGSDKLPSCLFNSITKKTFWPQKNSHTHLEAL
jgi:hypothetical protein